MSLGNKIITEVKAWTGVGIAVVLATLILLKIKEQDLAGDTCPALFNYSHTANLCVNATNSTDTTAILSGSVGSTIDSFVTALAEPKNWVSIVIIAIIGFALLAYYQSKRK